MVPRQNVLDDGEPEPGAAGLTRAAAIDAIEAFSQPRGTCCGTDADPGIGNDRPTKLILLPPDQIDLSTLRGVAHGVPGEVAESAAQLVGATSRMTVAPSVDSVISPWRPADNARASA